MLDFNDPNDIVGATLDGRWHLARVVGQGGLGVVFEARSVETGEIRAIKILRPEFADSPEILQRFLDEIMPSVRIDHPGVARVYEAVKARDGTPYLVMELLQGQPLSYRMNQGRIPVEQAATIAKNILAALGAAHAAGVVHRDLKPGNVFLVGDAVNGTDVRVLDFGIALVVDAAGGMQRKTRTGMMLGTPGYMSPEQIKNIKHADTRADLWAAGIILYEMLTAKPAFEAENDFARVTKVLTGDPVPIDQVAPQYAHWVPFFQRALAKNPAERFQTSHEMQLALDSVARFGRMPDAAVAPDTRQSGSGPDTAATGFHHASGYPSQIPPQDGAQRYSAPSVPPRRFGGDTAVSPSYGPGSIPVSGDNTPAVQVVSVPYRRGVPLALVLILCCIVLSVGFALGLVVGRW